MRRRGYLATAGALVLAGCSGGGDDGGDGGGGESGTTSRDGGPDTDDSSGDTGTAPETTAEPDQDTAETTDEPESAVTERWRVEVPATHLARTGEALVAGGGDRVTVLDADGSVAWETTVQGEVDDVRATAGTAAVAFDGGGVVGFDAASGERRWSFTLVESRRQPATLATAGGHVARLAGETAQLRVVDAESGEPVVTETYDASARALAGRSDGTVVLATAETTVAVDVSSGQELWSSDVTPAGDTVALGEELVVLGRFGGASALGAADGSERWRYEDGFTPRRATVGTEQAFLASGADDRLTAVSAGGGEENWTAEITGRETLPPVTVGGAVVATPLADTLALLDPGNGEVLYERGDFRAPSGVAAGDSRLAVGSDDRVRSFDVDL